MMIVLPHPKAHIHSTEWASPKQAKAEPAPVRGERTCRGIRLQAIAGHTRFSRAEITRAVKAAILKHADALARET